jgi:tellurite resistance protein TehA-like permease
VERDMKLSMRRAPSQSSLVVEMDGATKVASVSRRFARSWIENLPPSKFSLVMATGIISIASNLLGMTEIARGLFLLNIAFYGSLWALTALRFFFYPRRMLHDLQQSAVGPGYFTIVAATCVVGAQCVAVAGDLSAAMWLWFLGTGLWLVITYSVFTAIIVSPRKPAKRRGLNGFWLIAAVATQSVSALAALIAAKFDANAEIVLFVSLIFYLMGCMLYINIIVLIFHRLTFIPLTPEEMTPPYWISMGAAAITTQAGAALILNGAQSRLLTELTPYIKGFTLFFWAAGTWWIPLLIALGVWTHIVRRVPLNYTPQFWGVVFPLGMYTASTFQLARATGQNFLFVIPNATIYIALLAWALALAGMFRRFVNDLAGARNG